MIIRRLPDGEPKREIAKALCMTGAPCSAAFRKGDVLPPSNGRHQARGIEHLRQLHLSLAETAYLLGFADQGNLTRACKRWFELTPGQYRTGVGGDRPGPTVDA